MNRRDFMRALSIAPLAAVPAVAEPKTATEVMVEDYEARYNDLISRIPICLAMPNIWPLCPRCFGRPKMEIKHAEIPVWDNGLHMGALKNDSELFYKRIAQGWRALHWRCPECGYEAVMRRDDE